MNTSYFSKYQGDHGVCIAARAPEWFTGKCFPELAPTYRIWKKYQDDGDEEAYIIAYQEEVLSKLDPAAVYAELGPDAVLLCWEGKNKFCHRYVVADWLEKALGGTISEL